MKKNILTLFALICVNISFAQDKNILAKIAYEDAETAYAVGNFIGAIDELKKIDSLLGKKTPKSQYLRVQVWLLAAEKNPANIDGAITVCKDYLNLSKSFDIPEEKVIDVTRIIVRLNAQKASLAEKQEAEKQAREAIEKFFENEFDPKWPLNINLKQLDSIKGYAISSWNTFIPYGNIPKMKVYHLEDFKYSKLEYPYPNMKKNSVAYLSTKVAVVCYGEKVIGYHEVLSHFDQSIKELRDVYNINVDGNRRIIEVFTRFLGSPVVLDGTNSTRYTWKKGTKVFILGQYSYPKGGAGRATLIKRVYDLRDIPELIGQF